MQGSTIDARLQWLGFAAMGNPCDRRKHGGGSTDDSAKAHCILLKVLSSFSELCVFRRWASSMPPAKSPPCSASFECLIGRAPAVTWAGGAKPANAHFSVLSSEFRALGSECSVLSSRLALQNSKRTRIFSRFAKTIGIVQSKCFLPPELLGNSSMHFFKSTEFESVLVFGQSSPHNYSE